MIVQFDTWYDDSYPSIAVASGARTGALNVTMNKRCRPGKACTNISVTEQEMRGAVTQRSNRRRLWLLFLHPLADVIRASCE
jgi:hypothetical protein